MPSSPPDRPLPSRRQLLGGAAATALLPALPALLPHPARAAGGMIRLDPGATFQTMTGWEVTVDLFWDKALDPHVGEIFDRVADLGISRLRVGIFAGTENTDRSFDDFRTGRIPMEEWRARRYATVDDNGDPGSIDFGGFDFANLDWRIERAVLPMQKRLAARGERLAVNLNYVAFTRQTKGNRTYHHGNPAEYAEFVLATYLHMQEKYGFTPDTWEVILEPDLVKEWQDPRLVGLAMRAAAARLEERGFIPRFIAPSVTNAANAVRYLEGMASVPGALDHLAEFSYHRYQGTGLANIRAIGAAGARHGVKTAMLEWWFGKATWRTLHEDLVTAGVSAWQGRTLMTLFRLAGGQVVPEDDTRYNGLYFRAIRPGAVRIGATAPAGSGLAPVAFRNPDGRIAVLTGGDGAADLSIAGLPAGRYRIAWAVKGGSGAAEAPVIVAKGEPLALHLPGPGVISALAEPA